jgi:hypothetical protein
MVNVVMLSVDILSITIVNVVMMGVDILSVTRLNVIMLSVDMLKWATVVFKVMSHTQHNDIHSSDA